MLARNNALAKYIYLYMAQVQNGPCFILLYFFFSFFWQRTRREQDTGLASGGSRLSFPLPVAMKNRRNYHMHTYARPHTCPARNFPPF